jgi:hypothetical protein
MFFAALVASVIIIARFRPALFVEIDPEKLQQYGSNDQALLASITARGYTLHTLKGKAVSPPWRCSKAMALAKISGYVDLVCCP